VDIVKNFLNSGNLHENEAFDWITRVEMFLRNIDPVKRLWLVKLLPGLANGAKDNSPLLDIKSKVFLVDRG
jgi:hypothetical protein